MDRKKRNKEKIKEKKNKIKEKKRELCTKMRYMVGIGPIRDATIEYHENLNGNPEDARKDAVIEYLKYYLAYDDEEIEALEIIETKRAAKDDIIYCVFGRIEDAKEIHYRRAASQNDELVTRDYIPPQMYQRYQAIAHRAKIVRAANNNIKTQLRWGEKDIEVYTKTKGSEEQMKVVNLQEFMGNESLPDYDASIKWKVRTQTEQRKKKKLVFGQGTQGLPSMRNKNTDDLVSLVRQHSITSRRTLDAKRPRTESSTENTDEIVEMENCDNSA